MDPIQVMADIEYEDVPECPLCLDPDLMVDMMQQQIHH